MQLMRLLHNTFQKKLPNVHKLRLAVLMQSCETLLHHQQLSVTSLGRNLPGNVQERSNIRKMDRLVGNSHLRKELTDFYQVMNSYVLPRSGQVWIHVDWSCLNATTGQYVLRAALTMQSRSIVLYEEVHTKKGENNHEVHKGFLNKLKSILPHTIEPIIVTDAGFRAPWFRYVRSLGWDFVGRLRNKNAVLFDDSTEWQLSETYFTKASNKPRYLGHALLTEKGQVPVEAVIFKGKPKRRHKMKNNGKPSCSGKSKRHARAAKEPWFLVTSLSTVKKKPVIAVNIYKQRMRIEENFRDTKSSRYGFGLDNSISQSPGRFQILLLIAAIATFASWLSGLFMKLKGKAYTFQAQSAATKNGLSIVFIGRRALKKGVNIPYRQFLHLLRSIRNINAKAQEGAGL